MSGYTCVITRENWKEKVDLFPKTPNIILYIDDSDVKRLVDKEDDVLGLGIKKLQNKLKKNKSK